MARVNLGGETILTRQVEGGTGEGNQNDLTLHFGLGNHSGSVGVEITWPDGTIQTVQADSNQTLRIPYNLTTALSEVEVGEVSQIASLTHHVQTVLLNRLYDNPVVFAQSTSFHGDDPVVVRVANVQPDRFEIFLAEPSDENGVHNAGETVTYMVLEAGNHHLLDGTRLEVGTVETTHTVGNQFSNRWESVFFTTAFDATPVVLSQIQTQSTTGADFLKTRHLSTTSVGVTFALEQEEAATSAHSTETIGYLAIDSGTGTWNNMAYEARTKNFIGTGEFNQIRYSIPFETIPSLLASLTSYFGPDNAHLRYTNLSASGVRIKAEEDTTFDSEMGHTPEHVSYLAIGGQGMLTSLETQVAVGEVGTITDLTHVPQVIQLSRAYDNPVVFAQSVSGNGTDSTVVRVTSSALQLANTADISNPIDLASIGFSYDANSRTATWDFSSLSRLEAAWYTVRLDASQISDTSGLMLDGNGDGTTGDPYTHTLLVAQRGDSDLDGDVDVTDFNTLKQYFDPLGLGGMNDWSRADFDRDGDIDVTNIYTLVKIFLHSVMHRSPRPRPVA